MLKLIIKKNNTVSIKEHYLRRNKVLIERKVGGVGDIIMQRMMMEDLSKTGLDIYYACPMEYMDLMNDHPYLKEVKEISNTKKEEYGISYDITRICAITESSAREKNKKHRSDIWANYCGINLEKHETYLKSNKEILEKYKKELKKINIYDRPVVFLSTKSVNNAFGDAKSLTNNQVKEIILKLLELNCFIITADKDFQEIYSKLGIKQFLNLKHEDWIALIDASDFIISIDTAAFHIAGSLKKPLVGIFGFTDGKIYGKYYDFILVQKHRDNGNWPCGPCFVYTSCSKDKINNKKPCITELTSNDVINGFKLALEKWAK